MKSSTQLSSSYDILKSISQLYAAHNKLNKDHKNTTKLIDKLIEQMESNN